MGLEDAAWRRRGHKQAAKAAADKVTAKQSALDAAYDAAVAQFDPLLRKFGAVARPFGRRYATEHRSEHKRQRRAVMGGAPKAEFVSRHEITPGLTAILFGNGDVMVELSAVNAFGPYPALLLVGLTEHHWRLRRGSISGQTVCTTGWKSKKTEPVRWSRSSLRSSSITTTSPIPQWRFEQLAGQPASTP